MSPLYTDWHYLKKDTVSKYNKLRKIPKKIIKEITEVIIKNSLQLKNNEQIKIVDAGCGNGRIFIPLLKKINDMKLQINNFQLIGIDFSSFMLQNLLKKIQRYQALLNLTNWVIIRDDLQKNWVLGSNSVNVVYQFATFHILIKWQDVLKEIDRVLKKNGKLVYIKEINNIFHASEKIYTVEDSEDVFDIDIDKNINLIFKYYHKMREEFGYSYKKYGIEYSDISLLLDFFKRKGYSTEILPSLYFNKTFSYKDILNSIKNALVTTLGSDLPQEVRETIYNELKSMLIKRNVKIDERKTLKSKIQIFILSKK